MSKLSENLAQKIKSHTAQVGVVGLGYVGLPLVVEFAEAGFGHGHRPGPAQG